MVEKKKYSVRQKVALGMLLISCLLYVLLPFNICLSFSACVIAGITAVMWGSSEVLFYVGGVLLGKSAMDVLKKKLKLRKNRR